MQQKANRSHDAVIESAMRRALELATRGPAGDENPQVGCVILNADGRIVAEGWHRGIGTKHAETDALAQLPTEWRDRAHELTAVVTLEPCNHTGHTGPCSKALIEAGIGAVVYALQDPGDRSSGGAEELEAAGITVTGGVLATEARMLLAGWLARQQRHPISLSFSDPGQAGATRPHIIAKWAQTLDGRAAAHDGSSQWITGPEARQHVHAERALADAILVGTGTLTVDNPTLTARDEAGELLVAPELQPIPVVLGTREMPADAAVRNHPALDARGFDAPIQLTGASLVDDMETLGSMGIRTLYVEGGPTIVSALLLAGLVDEVHLYLAPKLLGGDGVAIGDLGISTITQALQLEVTGVKRLGVDLLISARPATPAPPTIERDS